MSRSNSEISPSAKRALIGAAVYAAVCCVPGAGFWMTAGLGEALVGTGLLWAAVAAAAGMFLAGYWSAR